MRYSGTRLPLLAALVFASALLSVWAMDRTFGDTIYVLPTTATVSVSNPYAVTSPYVLPASYVVPSYIPTSYAIEPAVSLLPTGYIETTYRRGLFGRRWVVERPVVASYSSAYIPTTYVSAYVPTTYVAPTYYSTGYQVRRYRPTTYTYYPSTYYPSVYETAYTTPADICCDQVVMDRTVRTVPPSSTGSYTPPLSSKEVGSSSIEDPTIPEAYVDTPPAGEAMKQRSTIPGGANTKAQTNADSNRADSPPTPPVPAAGDDESKAATPKNAPVQKSGAAPVSKKANPPAAPANDPDKLEPAPEQGFRRESMKAIYPRLRSVNRRNILFGTVETEAGQPRPEVPVIVVSRSSSSIRHNGVSNAFGGFAIRVPDGQWIVRVTMPSGTTQPVREITVTNGTVMDNAEAIEVRNLIISY